MQRSCSRWILAAAIALICLSMGQLFSPSVGRADDDRVAEPNPPTVDLGGAEVPKTAAAARQTAAATEWTYHKTSDNLHPDGNEQQFLWLLNRARSNPVQEGIWLATMGNPEVAASRDYFNVDEAVLQREFAGYAAQPPAAFDARLYSAAKAHSDYLISIDGQNHNNQIDRISSAGFRYSQAAAIVFSYSQNTIHGYAGFNIDWGAGTDGTQDPPGHRYAIMSIGGNYANVGVAMVPETNPATRVGPQVVSGNLCYANTGFPDHYNRFIVGTVWEDTNANDQYDSGEGLAGVTVMPDKGAYYAVTGESGGYAIPILSADVYELTFAGGDLTGVFTQAATVGAASVLLDLEYYTASSTSQPVNGGTGGGSSGGGSGAGVESSASGGGGGGGCLIGTVAEGIYGGSAGRGFLAVAILLAGLAFYRSILNRRRRAACIAAECRRRVNANRRGIEPPL